MLLFVNKFQMAEFTSYAQAGTLAARTNDGHHLAIAAVPHFSPQDFDVRKKAILFIRLYFIGWLLPFYEYRVRDVPALRDDTPADFFALLAAILFPAPGVGHYSAE